MAELNTDPAKKGSEEFNKLETYGDLKKLIKSIATNQKIGNIKSQGKSFAVDQLLGFFPGASNAKTAIDFVKAAVKKPDTKKSGTWLDKLDIDDNMSAIVDDTIENGFMQAMSKSIEQESDTKPLEPDFNMNAKMVNYLKQQYSGRTVAGIKENQEMTLKEYIKSFIRQELEEMSGTGAIGVGAGPIMTPNWVAPKGQKKNAATKTAEKQGFIVTKGETQMPGDSKVRDYVSLTGKKKKKVKIYENISIEDALKQIRPLLSHTIKHDKLEGTFDSWLEKVKAGDDEILDKMWNLAGSAVDKNAINVLSKINESDYDKASPSSNPSLYSKASGYTGVGKDNHASTYYKENMNESLINIVKEELLNEVTYHKFKNEVKFRTKNEQLHKAIREVKRKLAEIDRIVEYTSRMKQELSEGEEGLKYWKKTESNIATISEMVNTLNNKIKTLNQ